jgi:predicted nucleic acid-binding protein
MMRPTISRADFNLRLFVDTNVLIDYLEDFDGNKGKSFLELFKKSDFENIELVTSDYVRWELYGHFRADLYAREMITARGWSFNRTRKRINEFKGVTMEEMGEIGKTVKNMVNQLEESEGKVFIPVRRLMSEQTEGFSEIIERVLQSSKISYKDTMVLVSALYTETHILVTIDEQFKEEGRRITKLGEERESVPTEFLENSGLADLKFEPPSMFSSEEEIKRSYKEWFDERNEKEKLGKVIEYCSELNVIGVECFKDYTIKEGDYIYVVKFIEAKSIVKRLFKVEKGCLRDYVTEKTIREGKKVTIKLPDDLVFNGLNIENAIIFLSGE